MFESFRARHFFSMIATAAADFILCSMRMRLLAALLTSGLLSACASPGGAPPSLLPRPAEAIDPRVPVDRPVNSRPVDAAVASRLAALVSQAQDGDAAFQPAVARAAELAAAAGAAHSESWVVAQEALSAAIAEACSDRPRAGRYRCARRGPAAGPARALPGRSRGDPERRIGGWRDRPETGRCALAAIQRRLSETSASESAAGRSHDRRSTAQSRAAAGAPSIPAPLSWTSRSNVAGERAMTIQSEPVSLRADPGLVRPGSCAAPLATRRGQRRRPRPASRSRKRFDRCKSSTPRSSSRRP